MGRIINLIIWVFALDAIFCFYNENINKNLARLDTSVKNEDKFNITWLWCTSRNATETFERHASRDYCILSMFSLDVHTFCKRNLMFPMPRVYIYRKRDL